MLDHLARKGAMQGKRILGSLKPELCSTTGASRGAQLQRWHLQGSASSLLSKVPFLGGQTGGPLPRDAAIVGLAGLFFVGVFYTWHSIWVSAEMYSAPSIVMQTRGQDGSLHIFDDFREGYAWLRYNTPDDAVVGSWCGLHTLCELFKL